MVKLIKPRYKYYEETNQLYDNEKDELYAYNLNKNKIISILNQQDKRIKELEQENLSLQEQSIRDNQNWIEETTQLKQQLHDLPKKIMEEIKTEVEKEKSDNDLAWLGFKKLNRILDTILEKFRRER